jgi:hypothetical protein
MGYSHDRFQDDTWMAFLILFVAGEEGTVEQLQGGDSGETMLIFR